MIIVRISGGLGNQMFEYTLARWLVLHGKNVKLDLSPYRRANRGKADTIHNGYELNRIFGAGMPIATREEINRYSRFMLDFSSAVLNQIFGYKKTHITREKLSKDAWYFPELLKMDDAYLNGYWCSFHYADDIEQDIREQFVFSAPQDQANLRVLEQIGATNSVSIHVRRGDYLKLAETFRVLDEAYYTQAMRMVEDCEQKPVYFCFSDDIDWCKRHIVADDIRYIDWNTEENSYLDMMLMSKCKHNIVANSTFSMWAAWLNENQGKKVLCPKSIYVNERDMPRDIYPEEWIKI